MNTLDHSLLTAALEGLEHRRQVIDSQIAELRSQLGGRTPKTKAAAPAHQEPKRRLSPAGRKRIADAARKRWAALREQKAKQTKKRASKSKPASKPAEQAVAAEAGAGD